MTASINVCHLSAKSLQLFDFMTFKLLQLVSLYFWMNQRQRLSAALNAAGQVRQRLSAVGEDRQWQWQWQWLNAALLDRRQ